MGPSGSRWLFGVCLLVGACKASEAPSTGGTGGTGENGGAGTGGEAPGQGGTGGVSSGQGGNMSTAADASARGDDGPMSSSGGAGGATGTGGGGGSPPTDTDASADRPAGSDGRGPDGALDSDFLPGRPDIRLCKKEWSNEQCCAFLCSCLGTICADSQKAKPGLANCMSWCPKISTMAVRCHVYHCYVSISPTGGINDHDSHCGHAANQVQGGGCPTVVYQ